MNRGAREMRSDLDTLEKIEREIAECGGLKELGELYSISKDTVCRWHNTLRSRERVKRWANGKQSR